MKVMRTLGLFLAASAADKAYALAENTMNTSSLGGNENKQGSWRFVGGGDACQGQTPEAAFLGDSGSALTLESNEGGNRRYSYLTLQEAGKCDIECQNDGTECVKFTRGQYSNDPRDLDFLEKSPPVTTTELSGYGTEGRSFTVCHKT